MNRVAILIDGGFFLKRLPDVRPRIDCNNAEEIHMAIRQLVATHLQKMSGIQETRVWRPDQKTGKQEFAMQPHWFAQLFRCFYYDAKPFDGTGHKPITKEAIDYDKSSQATLRRELFDRLRREPNFALRLGRSAPPSDYMWALKPLVLKSLIKGERKVEGLCDEDFQTSIRQKGVDIRLGVDMASIALKKQANVFVMVTGDADFVPAAKLARREGCRVILDPLYQQVPDDLFEHIDGLTSGLPHPRKQRSNKEVTKPEGKL